MKPFLTGEQRNKAVYEFAAGCINQSVKIKRYSLITQLMNNKTSQIQPITAIEPTGTEPCIENMRIEGLNNSIKYQSIRRSGKYSDDDARKYVDYLLQVVLGSVHETEEKVSQANDQIFYMIGVLRDDIEKDGHVIFLMENRWNDELEKLEEKLEQHKKETERSINNQNYDLKKIDEFQESIEDLEKELQTQRINYEQMDERVMDVLEKIRNWQRKYEPCLKENLARWEEDNEKLVKVLKPSGADAKGKP